MPGREVAPCQAGEQRCTTCRRTRTHLEVVDPAVCLGVEDRSLPATSGVLDILRDKSLVHVGYADAGCVRRGQGRTAGHEDVSIYRCRKHGQAC